MFKYAKGLPILKNEDKKIQKAVALKYNKPESDAPKVVAKGRLSLAEHILEVAKKNDIPIQKNADLVEVLEKLEVEQEIPLELYSVVAEIFAYLYSINEEKKQESL